MINTRVVLCDMPSHVKGMVVKSFDDGEDYYTIVINSRLGREEQLEAYRHETRHLDQNDFDRTGWSVDSIEYVRHMAL